MEGEIQINSKEWLDERRKGIGSSDAPVILGISKYQTLFGLWEDKLGLRESTASNFATDMGHKFEPLARADLELKIGMDMPPVMGIHEKYDYLRATFDGLNETNKVFCEIKLVGASTFDSVLKNGCPPSDHYAQMMHQFLVSGYDRAYYVPYCLNLEFSKIDRIAYLEVTRSDQYIKSYLEKAQEFWEMVKTRTKPKLEARDTVVVDSPEALSLAAEYVIWKVKLNEAEAMIESIRDQIFEICPHNRCQIGGLTVLKGKQKRIMLKGESNDI